MRKEAFRVINPVMSFVDPWKLGQLQLDHGDVEGTQISPLDWSRGCPQLVKAACSRSRSCRAHLWTACLNPLWLT